MKIKQIILPLALCLLLCACTAAPAQSEGAENAAQPPLAAAETLVSTAAPETSAADEAFFQAAKDCEGLHSYGSGRPAVGRTAALEPCIP